MSFLHYHKIGKEGSCRLESEDREQVMAAHSCNPSTVKAEADCSVRGQPRL